MNEYGSRHSLADIGRMPAIQPMTSGLAAATPDVRQDVVGMSNLPQTEAQIASPVTGQEHRGGIDASLPIESIRERRELRAKGAMVRPSKVW